MEEICKFYIGDKCANEKAKCFGKECRLNKHCEFIDVGKIAPLAPLVKPSVKISSMEEFFNDDERRNNAKT
jgi:hypothetical protein